ncbi:hypothetical protein KEM48_011759 [Puccinia striiformis f. sp. tritici PST-130]|nr:hypothetical protein KEM48_011759 [Puccinia striiformis f. sp. tritici PST-130]
MELDTLENLKETDKIIENHNALLKLDPSNQTLQDGLAHKKESRDQSFNQIKKISHDFSIEFIKSSRIQINYPQQKRHHHLIIIIRNDDE